MYLMSTSEAIVLFLSRMVRSLYSGILVSGIPVPNIYTVLSGGRKIDLKFEVMGISNAVFQV